MSSILRSGLLNGVSVRLRELPGPDGAFGLERGLSALGARVSALEAADADAVRRRGAVDALVLDCSAWVPEGDRAAGAVVALQGLLDHVWTATEATANGSFISGGDGGRMLFIAPRDRDRFTGRAVVAALENLARTLSVEWARYGITAVVLAPAPGTRPQDVLSVTAFLLSPAGAYFSGTRLDLDPLTLPAPAPAHPARR